MEQNNNSTYLIPGYSVIKAYLEPGDIELMERVARNLHDRLLIRLLFRLGCRISEALALKVSDIDFFRGTATILHLKKRVRLSCSECRARLGKMHQYRPVCGKRVDNLVRRQQEHRRIRILPIDDSTLTLLKEYLAQNYLFSASRPFTIFRINRHRAWQIVRDGAKRSGLPYLINPETGSMRGVSPYRLRDAFSVHAMKIDDSGDGLRPLQFLPIT
jgi:integrase/recombinase XerD